MPCNLNNVHIWTPSYDCRSAELLSTFKCSLKTLLLNIPTVNVNLQPSLCHYAVPLIRSRQTTPHKCVSTEWLIDKCRHLLREYDPRCCRVWWVLVSTPGRQWVDSCADVCAAGPWALCHHCCCCCPMNCQEDDCSPRPRSHLPPITTHLYRISLKLTFLWIWMHLYLTKLAWRCNG